jgi:hypothetical protein
VIMDGFEATRFAVNCNSILPITFLNFPQLLHGEIERLVPRCFAKPLLGASQ